MTRESPMYGYATLEEDPLYKPEEWFIKGCKTVKDTQSLMFNDKRYTTWLYEANRLAFMRGYKETRLKLLLEK